ncbi:MAG TPA: aminotransferase class III-fold pyridoxal phosphate-dependent enzyme [Chloroflexota bacterium]|nr:aminotransferase class III-fold pyridoxal phosphate-dependent enzyme [Chloroflexota bacterium]
MSTDAVRHLMVDFTQMKAFAEDPLILERGEGIRLTDDRGRVYIDGASGVLTSNLGHANRDIVDAVAAQLGRLAFGAPTAATTTRALELVERMRALLPPQYTTMKFLSGGSEATETALKLARQYHRQTGHAGKYKVIAHYRGYHGGTGHALAASGWAHWKTAYEPYAAGFIHLSTPDPDRAPFAASSPEETGQLYAQLAEEAIALEDPETVAAVIIEPIMFSAGVVVPPDSYLRALRELCDRYNVLLIYDEIITAFGRTGTWFAAEHSGAWPDLLCCAKGMTAGYAALSAVFMTERVAAPFWGEPADRVQFHAGHTYGGNPVACAAALAALDYIERHGVIENAAQVGAYLAERLRALAARHPMVERVRGKGMLQALVLDTSGSSPFAPATAEVAPGLEVAGAARARGLLLRASPWFIAVAPPLVTTGAEVDEIVSILDEALTAVEDKRSGVPTSEPTLAVSQV